MHQQLRRLPNLLHNLHSKTNQKRTTQPGGTVPKKQTTMKKKFLHFKLRTIRRKAVIRGPGSQLAGMMQDFMSPMFLAVLNLSA